MPHGFQKELHISHYPERNSPMYRKLIAPINVQWEVTPACNYKCIHCYNAWRKNGNNIKEQDIDFMGIAEEIIKCHVLHVTISGGEPMLVFEKIKPSIQRLTNNGIEVSLNTNASLINDENSSELKQLGISSVLVSLTSGIENTCNAITQNENSWHQTLNGIKILCAHGLRVSVNMVITSLNIDDIYQTASLFRDIPIATFAATKAATPCGYQDFDKYRINKKQLEYVFDQLLRVNRDFGLRVSTFEFYPYCAFSCQNHFEKFGGRICSAGKTELSIAYNGDIKSCPHSTHIYGNYKEGIIAAWNKMEILRNESLIPEKCRGCKYVLQCEGGCKEEAYSAYGKYTLPDPFAEYNHCLNFQKAKKHEIIQDISYKINSNLKIRLESETHSLIYTSAFHWLLADKLLVKVLLTQKELSLNDLYKIYDVSEKEASIIIDKLLTKKIILKRGTENE